MALTLILDLGNFSSKYGYIDKKGNVALNSFSSVIHKYKEMEGMKDVTRVTFNSNDYFVGEGVKNFYLGKENQMYFGNVRKGHREGEIRLIYALYSAFKETKEREFNLVITSPYDSIGKDKKYFDEIFKGKRVAYIDDQPFEFEVKNLIVAAEGLGALHFIDALNCVIVDAGSMTMNILQIFGGSISKEDSLTLNGGTIQNTTLELADRFFKACPHIDLEYPLVTTGGRALEMKKALESIGYENVLVAETSEDVENYYLNLLGIILKYSETFEELFQ